MKNKWIGILIATMLGIVYSGCNREKEAIGPEYYVAPADFSVISFDVPDKTLDFSTEKCTINAQLSHKVTWTITITGASSGAVMTYTGVSDKIDASSLLWDGVHKDLFFFRKNEQATIQLSFFGSTIRKTETVTITKARNYSIANPNNIFLAVGDSNGYEAFAEGFSLPFGCCGVQFGIEELPATELRVADTAWAVEGNKVFKLLGSDKNGGYFVGGIQHRKLGSFFLPPSWTDPSQVYYNIFVYGTGDPNLKINLEFHEADLSNEPNKPISNLQCPGGAASSNQHCPCFDDAWVGTFSANHIGWKMISIKYSDMIPSASPTNGGSGDKVQEPNRVHRIQIGIVSDPNNNTVTAIWDYPIITYGAPFDPTK